MDPRHNSVISMRRGGITCAVRARNRFCISRVGMARLCQDGGMWIRSTLASCTKGDPGRGAAVSVGVRVGVRRKRLLRGGAGHVEGNGTPQERRGAQERPKECATAGWVVAQAACQSVCENGDTTSPAAGEAVWRGLVGLRRGGGAGASERMRVGRVSLGASRRADLLVGRRKWEMVLGT